MQPIITYETHTVGEPTRIVVEGFPIPEGSTMMEKKEYLEKHYDHLRTALLCEPRGHKDMVGALITTPCNPAADIGVIFMDSYRWINMCGHASMGCAYTAVKAGLVKNNGADTEVKIDTPAGLVSVHVNPDTRECTLYNVPSFLYRKGCSVTLDGQMIPFDIAFGGTFFALVNLNAIGRTLKNVQVPDMIAYAKRLLAEVNRYYTAIHPIENIRRIVNVEFYEKQEPLDGQLHYKNLVISEEGEVDRSPCGTGTSAELSAIYAEGGIGFRESFINESFLGATFRASVTKDTTVGDFSAIVPSVTGKVYIIGKAENYLLEDDPYQAGFHVF